MRIKSPDPLAHPAIFPNYLSEELDRRLTLEVFKACRKFAASPALKQYISEEYMPGKSVSTEEEMMEYARRAGSTVFHPTSTCRMGQDDMAVVDERLRVRGVEGAARRRCFHHADDDFREHMRCVHDDRRKGRGSHPRGCAALMAVRRTIND